MKVKNTMEEVVEGLAVEMRRGFEAVNKNTDSKIEKLAIAVKHGFDDVAEEFKSVRGEIRETKEEVGERLTGVEKELSRIKFNSSDINSRI